MDSTPPIPGPPTEAWPPPPSARAVPGPAQNTWTSAPLPFRSAFRRAPGKLGNRAIISEFRTGMIQVGTQEIAVWGRAVQPAEVRLPIVLGSIFFAFILVFVAALVMEYGFRRDLSLQLPWDSLRAIRLDPTTRRVCLLWEAVTPFGSLNKPGQLAPRSLACTLDDAGFAEFAEQAHRIAPSLVTEGALANGYPPAVLVLFAVCFVIFFGCIVGLALMMHH